MTESLADTLNELESQDFMGISDFVWWYGVVEDRRDPLYLGRLKVRCIGFHTDDKKDIPTDELPWAQVISPITSSGISGIGTTPIGVLEGSHVFGFFRDGREGQEPVVLGTCVGIPSVIANNDKGFFDPRSYEDRTMCPYPPFFIDRTRDGKPGFIVDFDREANKEYIFKGENSHKGRILSYEKDFKNGKINKAVALVKGYEISGDEVSAEPIVFSSLQTFSPNPNENFMEFYDGKIVYSFPSTPSISYTKQQIKLKTDRELNEFPPLSDIDEYKTTFNPFSNIFNGIYGVESIINQYRMNLHTNILTADPKVTINVPPSCFSPEYPFNHVTQTESGHLFELDDTPGKERVRLLHRSTSFIEFQNDGSRYDNVIGKYYLMTDTNFESHIMGNEIKNVGGRQNILVNSRGAATDSILRVKGKGNYTIQSDLGDVTISAGNVINLKAQNVVYSPQNVDNDVNRYALENMAFEVKKSKSVNFDDINEFKIKTLGSYGINAGSIDQSIMGDLKNSINGNYTKTVIGTSAETYQNPNPLSNAKSEGATLGNLFHYVANPLAKITLCHALNDVTPGLTPMYTGIDISSTGFDLVSNLGNTIIDMKVGNINMKAGQDISLSAKVGQIDMKNIIGANINLGIDGLISIKNNASSLKMIIDKLIDGITRLTVTTPSGPSGPPINVAEFTALKTELLTLLK